MESAALTIGPLTSVFLTSYGGHPGPPIAGVPDPADHGMQEARGSNPLSSTPPGTAFLQLSRGDFRAAFAPVV